MRRQDGHSYPRHRESERWLPASARSGGGGGGGSMARRLQRSLALPTARPLFDLAHSSTPSPPPLARYSLAGGMVAAVPTVLPGWLLLGRKH